MEDFVFDEQPKKGKKKSESKELKSCLRNERVIVRFIKKPTLMVKDPEHVAYGGTVEGGHITFSGLPRLTNGTLKNCLTNAEKDYLEYILGLDDNALSVYKNPDENFWISGNGNAEITLSKEDTYLDLSNPRDYIIYKMLLAWSDRVCPSMEQLRNTNKATYKFVLINENDEAKAANEEMSTASRCYYAFGNYKDNADVLKVVIETLTGKSLSPNTKIEFLRQQINEQIKANPKLFLSVIEDEYIETKALIHLAVENGIISKRGDFYYMTDSNQALSEGNTDPTLTNAAKFLSNAKRQDLLLTIQAKVKQ